MTYAQALKHPKWQRRRLEIMSRDKFRCTRCSADSHTLNVHHKVYRRGSAPWDYTDAELVTLCETCHEAVHDGLQGISLPIARQMDREWRRDFPDEAALFDAEKVRQLAALQERGIGS